MSVLRINLMPAYIAEQRKTKAAVVGTVAGVVAVIGGLLGFQYAYLVPTVNKKIEDANEADSAAKAVEKTEADVASLLASIKVKQDKNQFIREVAFNNSLTPQIYRNVAKYTYRKVEYDAMSLTGDTLNISAYVMGLSDVGKFYLTLWANPDLKAVSIASQLPAWNKQNLDVTGLPSEKSIDVNAGRFPIQIRATLLKPIVTPVVPGGTQQPGMPNGMMGGAGSPMGGFGGRNAGAPGMAMPPMGGGAPAGSGGGGPQKLD